MLEIQIQPKLARARSLQLSNTDDAFVRAPREKKERISMSARSKNPIVAELRKFLRKYPDTGVIELLIADVTGVLRGKRVRTAEFEKVFADGFFIPGGTVLLA